jgi:hypothetical protein
MNFDTIREEILQSVKLTQEEQKNTVVKRTFSQTVYESVEVNPDNIIPKIIPVDSTHVMWNQWISISEHVASFAFRRSPGRNMYFLIKNEYDGRNLGVIDVGADFLTLGERDKYIGWIKEDKLKRNRNIANISICVPTRAFGYNLSGGKLLSLLAISNTVIDRWKQSYGDDLAGVTVTSLYGRGTQYNRLKYFKYLGLTKGQGTNQMPDEIYRKLRNVVEAVHGEIASGRFTVGKNSRINIIRQGCKILNIKASDITTHGFQRGIYWADLADNTKEFLKGETSTLNYYDLNVTSLTQYWRETWANRRLKNLTERNELIIPKTFF